MLLCQLVLNRIGFELKNVVVLASGPVLLSQKSLAVLPVRLQTSQALAERLKVSVCNYLHELLQVKFEYLCGHACDGSVV